MEKNTLKINEMEIPVISLQAAVVGSGCAGFNAADWLYDLGCRDIAMVTEGVNMGTSRNTGSDKQTYYKLSLASGGADSVGDMARDLYAGGGVNGDTALAEAAGSVRSFMKLVNLGVPFPTNRYGEYVGYKTDHDPRQRATSAGPLTSRYMTERLEESVNKKGIPILDGLTVIRLLVGDGAVVGLLCLDQENLCQPHHGLTVIQADRVILATGGPAGCYEASVYPESQTGMSGMAWEAGVQGANLNEWQYGMASLKFRWNVSGTYQQVLPRYISIDRDGLEHEFLPDYLDSPRTAMDMVFLKGYQWPFDAARIDGSSRIDQIVHHEICVLNRRVYMDYRKNPSGLEAGFESLSRETYDYLNNSGACFGTPIQRLEKMNPLAIQLYRDQGIDLYHEPLEIGVCAQHHNGGMAVDKDWQTTIRGLYAAGEAAGTFGGKRPGGSALNSTQVGSLRAAEHIVVDGRKRTADIDGTWAAFEKLAVKEAKAAVEQMEQALKQDNDNAYDWQMERRLQQHAMTACASHIRRPEAMKELERCLGEQLEHFWDTARASSPRQLPQLWRNRDILLSQLAVLSAMVKSADEAGSHGSALVEQGECNTVPKDKEVLVTVFKDGLFHSFYQPVREIPHREEWFETVWNDYRSRMGS